MHLGHTDAVVVLTTLANTDEAVKFVKQLLERRLVACGTILPGTRSLYRWEDKLADEIEVVVMLKTRSGATASSELSRSCTRIRCLSSSPSPSPGGSNATSAGSTTRRASRSSKSSYRGEAALLFSR
jgi:uncharacterized protein involved in tolerance to divalent cations